MASLSDFLFPKKKKDKEVPRINMDGKPLPPEALGTGGLKKAAKALKGRDKKLQDALNAAGG